MSAPGMGTNMDETFEQVVHRYWGQFYLRTLLWLRTFGA